ncbi:MAG: hypothetical protein JNK89_06895 [Saprospiraceae bacterium]|nr:hypothetical protein [Saprospiraceae bacterium]
MKYLPFLFCMLWLVSGLSAQTNPTCPPGTNYVPGKHGGTTLGPTPIDDNPVTERNPPSFLNDRIIYWVHGLGGSPDSWARVGQATQYQAPGQSVPGYPHRKVSSLYPAYFQFSFSGAASTLHNQLVSMGDPVSNANGIEDKTINFIVGHSQGGLVARATDKMYADLGAEQDRRFGGIVTFGSSHQGARILNNEAQINSLGIEGCQALGEALVLETAQQNALLDFIIPNEKLINIKNRFCDVFGEFILPTVFKDQNQPITEDYKVGAAAIGELNGYASNLPKVAFYGVETEPVFYRVMFNLAVKTPNTFPPFGADDDTPLVTRYNGLVNKYKAEYEKNKARVEYLESVGLPCSPWQWIFMTAYCTIWDTEYWQKVARRNAWKKGYDWLLASNNKWKQVIGARSSQTVAQTTWQCNCGGFTFPISNPANCPTNCPATSNGTIYVTQWTEKENDGVVLAESAGGFPGAPAHALPGSNHQQMRNDSNTKARMNEVLNGAHSNYFLTEPR